MNINQQQEKFSELQIRCQKANEAAIQINTKIEAAKEQYAKLSKLAVDKYGTDNIEELKSLLIKWREENEAKILSFESAVSSLESEVSEKNAAIKEIQNASN